jgi:hypothetical protein
MRIDVRFDAAETLQKISAYGKKVRDRALVRALNRTATTVRAVGARLIAAPLKSIKVSDIKKSINIKFANRSKLLAIISVFGRKRIPLTAYSPIQTATGVTVSVGGKVFNIPHAFIRKIKRSGRLAVRIRSFSWRAQLPENVQFRSRRVRGPAKVHRLSDGSFSRTLLGDPDYPIAEIAPYGIRFGFSQENNIRAMRKVAIERFSVVLAQELKFLSSKG